MFVSSNISEGVINGGNRVLKVWRGLRVVVGYVYENKMCIYRIKDVNY